MKDKQAKQQEYDEVSQLVYDRYFAYSLLAKCGEKQKEYKEHFYTLYEEIPEPEQVLFYREYMKFYKVKYFINIQEKPECLDSGYIKFISGSTIKEIIKEIKEDNKAIRANTIEDLTGKESRHADNGFTPNYSLIFINAKNFKENLDDLINQAYVESNYKGLVIYDERMINSGKKCLIEIEGDGDYGLDRTYVNLNDSIIEESKKIAKKL